MKIYREREKEIYKDPPFKIKKEYVVEALSETDLTDLKVRGDLPGLESVLEELGIELKENSKNLLVVSGVEETLDLENSLKMLKESFFSSSFRI